MESVLERAIGGRSAARGDEAAGIADDEELKAGVGIAGVAGVYVAGVGVAGVFDASAKLALGAVVSTGVSRSMGDGCAIAVAEVDGLFLTGAAMLVAEVVAATEAGDDAGTAKGFETVREAIAEKGGEEGDNISAVDVDATVFGGGEDESPADGGGDDAGTYDEAAFAYARCAFRSSRGDFTFSFFSFSFCPRSFQAARGSFGAIESESAVGVVAGLVPL